jgi:hypothetical protein
LKALSASSGSSFRATGISNERRREPSQQLVKPTEFSRTCVACRPEGARQNQGKRTPTKFSDEGRGMGSNLRKRVKHRQSVNPQATEQTLTQRIRHNNTTVQPPTNHNTTRHMHHTRPTLSPDAHGPPSTLSFPHTSNSSTASNGLMPFDAV